MQPVLIFCTQKRSLFVWLAFDLVGLMRCEGKLKDRLGTLPSLFQICFDFGLQHTPHETHSTIWNEITIVCNVNYETSIESLFNNNQTLLFLHTVAVEHQLSLTSPRQWLNIPALAPPSGSARSPQRKVCLVHLSNSCSTYLPHIIVKIYQGLPRSRHPLTSILRTLLSLMRVLKSSVVSFLSAPKNRLPWLDWIRDRIGDCRGPAYITGLEGFDPSPESRL